jgi:hypothetical protein
VGNGPFNIVVDDPDDLVGLPIQAHADYGLTLTRDGLYLDTFSIDLQRAQTWEPRPDWGIIRRQRDRIRSNLPHVRELVARDGTSSAFAPLLGLSGPRDSLSELVLHRTRAAVEDLRAGWAGKLERLLRGASRLAGLGAGLTPAGDDFLVGLVLWSWVAHPMPGQFCRDLLSASAARTTALSAAFLRAAGRGECSAPWQALLSALQATDLESIQVAVREILHRGATSGADALLGFLCLPLEIDRLSNKAD